MHGRIFLLGAAFLLGCDGAVRPPAAKEAPSPPAARAFDEAASGTISGQVLWAGELPQVSPYLSPPNPLSAPIPVFKSPRANPNLPLIEPNTKGVQDAVVFLRGVDPARARPWDQSPIKVVFRDDEMFVLQGEYTGRRGFVRRGDQIEVVSEQPVFHALQARGGAFFTLPLPDVGQARARRLDQAGVVELSSGVGRFWMRGHLFVDEHPYYVRTDSQGCFALPKVPEGKYQLVCWHPNWHEDVREHDADTYYLTRLTFQPSVMMVRDIEVRRSEMCAADFTLSLRDFVSADLPSGGR